MRFGAAGLNDCAVARATGIPRRTILDWRCGATRDRRFDDRERCSKCGCSVHDFTQLPGTEYTYLLGMYLGDGHISAYERAWRLRVSMCLDWPGILAECRAAMQAVFPNNRVSFVHPDPSSRCGVLCVYSRMLSCLFPQHGPGPKHLRKIELAGWQQSIVRSHPRFFIRGLIHSDGCRFVNRVTIKGKTYSYPRYNFTSASDDIRGLFTAALDQLGIDWRRMNARNVSVARRESVARLDDFVGPKS